MYPAVGEDTPTAARFSTRSFAKRLGGEFWSVDADESGAWDAITGGVPARQQSRVTVKLDASTWL